VDAWDPVSPGQRRAAEALIGGDEARTYQEAAEVMGVHVGTLYRHLKRLRERHPDVYAAVMATRAEQLAERHENALLRAAAHSREWLRRKRNLGYLRRFGCWPWEARAHRQRFGRWPWERA
jgi:hypothetical protein